jgi:threonine dehydrogenase-like Zn-dependent dehydrogenase
MKNRHVGVITGEGKFAIIEEPIPEPGRGEVLIEIKASLVSPGTEFMDVPKLRKEPDPKAEVSKFGYNSAGIIIKQGAGCEDIPLGLKVSCMGWGYALHTDYAVVPRNLVLPMPEGMSYEQATFAHLGATALQAIRRAELQLGENLLVVGLGPVGQLSLQLAEASAVHTIGVDKLSLRLEIAKKGGAELTVNLKEEKEEDIAARIKTFTRGYGIDCSILVYGGDATETFQFLRKVHKCAPDTHLMGRVVIPGACEFKITNWPASFGNIDIRASSRPGPGYKDLEYEHGKDYTPVFVQWSARRNMEEFLRLITLKKVNVDTIITHRLPFKDFVKGVEMLYTSPNKAVGVVFLF